MKKNTVSIAMIAALALTAVVAVMASSAEYAAPLPDQITGADFDEGLLAQAPQPGPQPQREPGADLRRRLNLTDEQARRVEQIMAAHRSRTQQLRINLQRARLDAREAFLQATPDRARLDTIARRIGELQGQLEQARFGMLLELKTVLNPEQWSRLGALDGPRGRFRRGGR
jgi:Spy/CpxP family protein refolding chaperone